MRKIIKGFILSKKNSSLCRQPPKNEGDRASTCTNAAPAKADITPLISIPCTISDSRTKNGCLSKFHKYFENKIEEIYSKQKLMYF
jgi:hypothetical protein